MNPESVSDGRPEGGGPGSIEEAINRFVPVPVMVAARIPFKERSYFVRWVQRLNEYRVRVRRRSMRTCRDADVVGFLRDQQTRFSTLKWQIKQAQEAVHSVPGSAWDGTSPQLRFDTPPPLPEQRKQSFQKMRSRAEPGTEAELCVKDRRHSHATATQRAGTNSVPFRRDWN